MLVSDLLFILVGSAFSLSGFYLGRKFGKKERLWSGGKIQTVGDMICMLKRFNKNYDITFVFDPHASFNRLDFDASSSNEKVTLLFTVAEEA